MKKDWTAHDMPLLTGKVAVVTGANSGLGYETVRALARKGAEVVMACRNHRKAEEAALMVLEEFPGAKLHRMLIDLSSLADVRAFAQAFLGKFQRLDILINNAGLMALPLRRTADGREMQFGTNHLGHFALTALLMPLIRATPGARVVQVSSIAYRAGRFVWDDLDSQRSYSKWGAYGRSKLANLLFAQELNRWLQRQNIDAAALAAHPGYAATKLQARGKEHGQNAFETWFMNLGNGIMAQSAEQGAWPQLYASTAPEAIAGSFYGPGGFLSLKGHPRLEIPKPSLCQPEDAARLWAASEKLCGVSFPT